MATLIRHSSHKQQGFSLIEVLIAMIILSIGLLALTALQLNSLRATNEARQVTTISLLAKEMADRMRANASQIASYAGTSVTEPSAGATDCGATACSGPELKVYDVNQWITGLGLVGPVGLVRGSIYQTNGVPGEYTIGIQWDDDRDGAIAAANECDGSYDAANPVVPDGCYKLRFKP